MYQERKQNLFYIKKNPTDILNKELGLLILIKNTK